MRGALPFVLALSLLVLLSSALVAEALANAEVEALIDVGSISVRIELSDINATLMGKIANFSSALNETTIPEAVVDAIGEGVFYVEPSIALDEEARTINASFKLLGQALMDFEFNRTSMAKMYKVRTSWRKTDVEAWYNKTLMIVRLNFSSFFKRPLRKWEHVRDYELGPGDVREALLLNITVRDALFENGTGRATWAFVLPRGARFLRAVQEGEEEFLVFEVPPGPLEILMASPFWPFLLIVMAVGLAVAYRRASVRLVKPEETP